jgi:ATP-binding cassette subfamily B (MDR/TAP) protein 1
VGWFDEEENNSNLVAARLATEATDVKSAIAERISVILQNMTSLLVSFIVGFIIEWRVAILILVTFPLLVLANFAQVKTQLTCLLVALGFQLVAYNCSGLEHA